MLVYTLPTYVALGKWSGVLDILISGGLENQKYYFWLFNFFESI